MITTVAQVQAACPTMVFKTERSLLSKSRRKYWSDLCDTPFTLSKKHSSSSHLFLNAVYTLTVRLLSSRSTTKPLCELFSFSCTVHTLQAH